jgi:P-type Ca2+ transporter type 2C
MMLASDAVVSNGEMIGDPTEGALVVLAEKGGLDSASTRAEFRASPSSRSTRPTS